MYERTCTISKSVKKNNQQVVDIYTKQTNKHTNINKQYHTQTYESRKAKITFLLFCCSIFFFCIQKFTCYHYYIVKKEKKSIKENYYVEFKVRELTVKISINYLM